MRTGLSAACLVWLVATPLAAQIRPKAELSARAPAAAPAGGATTLVLHVQLPADVHVQSNAPRDPSLIPTSLSLTPPDGVTLESIRYPRPTDLVQPGQAEPLAVFGSTFEIAVNVRVAATTAAGPLVVPARLRYQACDATTCYPPARAEVAWTTTVTEAR